MKEMCTLNMNKKHPHTDMMLFIYLCEWLSLMLTSQSRCIDTCTANQGRLYCMFIYLHSPFITVILPPYTSH